MANGRIEKGQPLEQAISAAAWNRAQDAADIVLGAPPDRVGEPAAAAQGAANIVMVRNGTQVDRPAAGILGIQGFAIQPDMQSEMPRIVTRPVLQGVDATESEHPARFVITLEPIPAGKIGRAAASGIIAFRMINRDVSHGYATVKGGMVDRLQSTECGFLQILARSTATNNGYVWCVGVM
jgi:hypothetical protein